jgi:hypothetical protein
MINNSSEKLNGKYDDKMTENKDALGNIMHIDIPEVGQSEPSGRQKPIPIGNDKITISVRFTVNERERVRVLAERTYMSLNSKIHQIVAEYLNQHRDELPFKEGVD